MECRATKGFLAFGREKGHQNGEARETSVITGCGKGIPSRRFFGQRGGKDKSRREVMR